MVAVHHREGSFSNKWIEYCKENNIKYKKVDCYSSSIVKDLDDCEILMWHWHHYDSKAILMARQLICSLELKGIKVFPNINTCWHFDDKLGQKYLLESIDAPMVKSYAFFSKKEANEWVKNTTFPKVFKLRNGAGSVNVKLIKSDKEARRYIRKSFSSGFFISRFENFKERLWQFKRDNSISNFINIGKGIYRIFFPSKSIRNTREKNYLYAQDFIPDNSFDIRINIIGKRAFGLKSMVRDGDFRASGSGNFSYNIDEIPKKCIKIAFKVTNLLKAQSLSFDFLLDRGEYKIVEISYAFPEKSYVKCPGYWDEELNFIKKRFYPSYFMIEDILAQLAPEKYYKLLKTETLHLTNSSSTKYNLARVSTVR
jgi:glutathione synthase/RimK-type ligase-like ATP-grasp enzyme